ncbi:MAG TPA: alpha-amylase family glycosyl hydrolase [Solirubrobacter sp.]|nr:alpha-amylase family glycosyl hydrolase [Solirubrobacter sp.]
MRARSNTRKEDNAVTTAGFRRRLRLGMLLFAILTLGGPAVASASGPPLQWWQKLQGNRVFYLGCGEVTLPEITAQIDSLHAKGYRVIEVFTPYHGEDSLNPDGSYSDTAFCGLAPLDYYAVKPEFGTRADWDALVNAAHSRGMAVIMWLNLGYTSRQSAVWQRARADKGAGLTNEYTELFRWSTTSNAPRPNNFRWVFDSVANAYYLTRWADQPAYDWSKPYWPPEAARVIRFWLDRGADGFVIDAAHDYRDLGMTPAMEREIITGIPRAHGNAFVMQEGLGGDPVTWIGGFNYTSVYAIDGCSCDQDFRNVVTQAMDARNPSGMTPFFERMHDAAVDLGGSTYAYPSFEASRPQVQRVLEAAGMVAGGVLMQSDPLDLPLSQANQTAIENIFRAANSDPAHEPRAKRRQVPTNDDQRDWAVLRTSVDGGVRALDVLNFQNTSQTITVDLRGAVSTPVALTNLETGTFGPPVIDGRVQVTLPAWGHVFFRLHPQAVSEVSATVPATLSLSLGGGVNFGAFTPGVAGEYTAATTANATSSAGDAQLSVGDPSPIAPGRLVNGSFSLPAALQARALNIANPASAFAAVGSASSPTTLLSWDGPISNDVVTLEFQQAIGATDALRTGAYGKTLTFTLSTTSP